MEGSSDYIRDRICRRKSSSEDGDRQTPDPARGALSLLTGRSADLRGEEEGQRARGPESPGKYRVTHKRG